MAATQVDQGTVIFSAVGDEILSMENILCFHIRSLTGVAGDVVEIQTSPGAKIIFNMPISGANFSGFYPVSGWRKGVKMMINTGNRAVVELVRRNWHEGRWFSLGT